VIETIFDFLKIHREMIFWNTTIVMQVIFPPSFGHEDKPLFSRNEVTAHGRETVEMHP
jgi:hypothetical protein